MLLRISLFKREILFPCPFLSMKFLISKSTHSLNSYLLSNYNVPVTTVGIEDIAENKTDNNFCYHGSYVLFRPNGILSRMSV